MVTVERHLTNAAYGFPRGAKRRVKPVALACIHITGNARTAKYTDLHAAADAERDYANRSGSTGPSAHYYVARDGWAIEAIAAIRFAAWSNGDVKSPNKANPGIVKVLKLDNSGYNANEAYWLEIENVGDPPDYPITAAQKQANAELIAAHAKRTGLPINRSTVHGHWEINGVDRRGCPAPYSRREAFLNDVIARATKLLAPAPQEDDMPPLSSYIPGQVATVRPNMNVRTAPDLSASVVRVTSDEESWIATGWVKGDVDDECGSDQWLVRWAGGRWEYTSKCNLASGPAAPAPEPPATVDCTAAIEAATAPISAALAEAEARIGAKNAALERALATIQEGRSA